jgi:hypothetical protein
MVKCFNQEKLEQLFAQFLEAIVDHNLSEFDISGIYLQSTISENLEKWRDISTQLEDLKISENTQNML